MKYKTVKQLIDRKHKNKKCFLFFYPNIKKVCYKIGKYRKKVVKN